MLDKKTGGYGNSKCRSELRTLICMFFCLSLGATIIWMHGINVETLKL